ncbi:MAG: hypothetical protein ACKVPX_17545 [Myxococcaceae bacterium]
MKVAEGVLGASLVLSSYMTMFAPSVLFELLAGFWLLIKGVNLAGGQPAESTSTRVEVASPAPRTIDV